MTPYEIVERLFPFAYSITGDGADTALDAYRDLLDFEVFEYAAGQEINGWTIPQGHRVHRAEIRRDGALVYDGAASPLGTVAQSRSFSGTVDRDTLLQHIHCDPLNAAAIPYHWRQLYGRGPVDWGFCMPSQLRDSLPAGEYEVNLECEFHPATMKVLIATLKGESQRTVLLNGHNCHPFQANDDISGCAVGIAAMRALAGWRNRRLTYQLMIAPELLGPMFWLFRDCADPSLLDGALLLKSVGNDGPVRLQHSFTGAAEIDRAALAALKTRPERPFETGAFRTVYGNDEIIFEAPGFEIPTVEYTRTPFEQYHSDQDRPETLSASALDETLDIVLDALRLMEDNRVYQRRFDGVPCLSSPRYDLYVPVDDRRLGADDAKALRRRWNLLMNCLPRYLEGELSTFQIAERHGLPPAAVRDYIAAWEEKGLVASELPPQRPRPTRLT